MGTSSAGVAFDIEAAPEVADEFLRVASAST